MMFMFETLGICDITMGCETPLSSIMHLTELYAEHNCNDLWSSTSFFISKSGMSITVSADET